MGNVANTNTWNGTGLKFAVTMTCEGFDMDEDDWNIKVRRGTKEIIFTRENSIQDENGQWYICVDTTLLGPGIIYIIFEALVPDTDFNGGVRKEIQKYELIYNKSL